MEEKHTEEHSLFVRNIKNVIIKTLSHLGLLEYAIYFHATHYQNLKKFSFREYKENIRFHLNGGAPDGLPVPGMYMIWLVFGSILKKRFIETGEKQYNELLLPILEESEIDIHKSNNILDFGCGCGRITRHLHSLKNTEVWGVDYNSKLIKWCRKHLSFANFQTNDLTPPLSFSDNKFDLIIARSVFTHFDKELQFAWLKELYRILKPGGYLFFTTIGDQFTHDFSQEEQEMYNSGEVVVVHGEYSGMNRCYVWHPYSYVKRVWLENGFEIINFKAGGIVEDAVQDSYLAKRI